jgi:hypothetical protein
MAHHFPLCGLLSGPQRWSYTNFETKLRTVWGFPDAPEARLVLDRNRQCAQYHSANEPHPKCLAAMRITVS